MKRISEHQVALAELRRLGRIKRREPAAIEQIGPALLGFYRESVEKRQPKLQRVADAWQQLVPEHLCAHCSLEGFSKGTLKVLVDSSAHLYELKQLMLSGVHDQMTIACKAAGLRKIVLRLGQW